MTVKNNAEYLVQIFRRDIEHHNNFECEGPEHWTKFL